MRAFNRQVRSNKRCCWIALCIICSEQLHNQNSRFKKNQRYKCISLERAQISLPTLNRPHSLQCLVPVRPQLSVSVVAAGDPLTRGGDYCEMRILGCNIIRLEWVGRRNATVHVNIFTVNPWNPVYVQVYTIFLFIIISSGEKHSERPLLDLCVTNGVGYKCTVTGQNNTVLLGTPTAIYNIA